MSEPKIIHFPSRQRNRRSAPIDGDAKLAADVHAAWRKLWRAIEKAQNAGLTVRTEFSEWSDEPTITKEFRRGQ